MQLSISLFSLCMPLMHPCIDVFAASSIDIEDSFSHTTGYPIHDAMIATGFWYDKISMSQMIAAYNCSAKKEKELYDNFELQVPEIIQKSLAKAEKDQGRVVEYTDQQVHISDNYEASIRSVTLSCFITTGWSHYAPASYASHIVASTLDIPPHKSGPRDYNVSMLIEANIVELGDAGLIFMPTKYCLDVDDPNDHGISNGGLDTLSIPPSKAEHIRVVTMGVQPRSVSSTINRVAWYTSAPKSDSEGFRLKSAFMSPKVELLGIIEAIARGCQGLACLEEAETIVNEEYGLQWDSNASTAAVSQYIWLRDRLRDWDAIREETTSYNELSSLATPLIFDRSIASREKNSPFLRLPTQFNPYHSIDDFLKLGITSNFTEEDAVDCVAKNDVTDTTASRNAALLVRPAINRRLYEYSGSPMNQMKSWFYDGSSLYQNVSYFQNVTWGDIHTNLLLRGNLTDKIMGLDAKWFMASEFTDSSNIQNLLETQQQSLQPFLNAAAEAVEVNNPCDKAATNSDIFVLCISMGLAACGGINAVLGSIHLALHVIYRFFRKRPMEEKGRTVPLLLRLLPTYEVIFVTLGVCVFVALFVPVYLQVDKEMEIANFKTSAADMEIHYAQREPLLLGKSALVTLVQTETWCENARPDLLKYLFIGGLILGCLINIPFVYISVIAWARYFKRILKPEAELPKDCTIYDRNLRILSGIEPRDDNDTTTGDQSEVVVDGDDADGALGTA